MESVEIEVYSLLRINDKPNEPHDTKNMTKIPLKEMEWLSLNIDYWFKDFIKN